MKKMLKLGLISALVAMTASCSSKMAKEEKQIDAQVKAQAPADSPEHIVSRAALAFSNVEGLTSEQKSKLSEIYTNVYMSSQAIRREMGQSKSLLFMTLAKPNYKESEISILKKKIVGLDQKRLNLMFGALDDVQRIVGKGKNAEQIYKHFYDHEIPNRFIGE